MDRPPVKVKSKELIVSRRLPAEVDRALVALLDFKSSVTSE